MSASEARKEALSYLDVVIEALRQGVFKQAHYDNARDAIERLAKEAATLEAELARLRREAHTVEREDKK